MTTSFKEELLLVIKVKPKKQKTIKKKINCLIKNLFLKYRSATKQPTTNKTLNGKVVPKSIWLIPKKFCDNTSIEIKKEPTKSLRVSLCFEHLYKNGSYILQKV